MDKSKELDERAYFKISRFKVKKRLVNKVLLFIGAFPLLLYPLVTVANIMTLAALEFSNSILASVTILFVLFTGSYILTYIIGFALYFSQKDKTILFSLIPLMHQLAILLIVSIFRMF